MAPCLAQRLELVDKAGDHRQALVPEGRVGGVEPERREQLLMPLGTAGAQHIEILRGKARLRALIDRVERVHQAIAEGIGVDIERRMDEMWDVGPVPAILILEADRWSQA